MTALTRAVPLREISLEPALFARPALLDQVLLRVLSNEVSRFARTHPLSLAVPLAFIFERLMEARRIRIVLRGTEASAPSEELLELVEARPR